MVNEIEIRAQEKKEAEAHREKSISRNERIIRQLCDQSKWNNIRIIGVPEEEEGGERIESVFEEVMAENLPNLGKEIVSQAMELHTGRLSNLPKITQLVSTTPGLPLPLS